MNNYFLCACITFYSLNNFAGTNDKPQIPQAVKDVCKALFNGIHQSVIEAPAYAYDDTDCWHGAFSITPDYYQSQVERQKNNEESQADKNSKTKFIIQESFKSAELEPVVSFQPRIENPPTDLDIDPELLAIFARVDEALIKLLESHEKNN